jgi:carboxyl-terminal processing protease
MEVLKLQKENIKGLIIDLVDNGGGPWKSKYRNVYRSPFQLCRQQTTHSIIMTLTRACYLRIYGCSNNGNTASASEFSLHSQDYNRGIIGKLYW